MKGFVRSSAVSLLLTFLTWPHCHGFTMAPVRHRIADSTERGGSHVKGNLQQHSLPTRLFMSDVPRPENNNNDDLARMMELPPPPEDGMIMTGDLLSIFVYGFSDHLICHDLAMAAAAHPSTDLVQASAASGSSASMSLQYSSLTNPVWLDPSQMYAPNVLQAVHESHIVTHYSPLLEDAGLACCVLASAWLLGGWLQGAFLTRNTLDCSTQTALSVTAKAWMVTCGIMAYVVATTSWLNDAILHAPLEWTGFTKGDADYVLDSLIVIAMWRWMASNILGTGGGDGGGSSSSGRGET